MKQILRFHRRLYITTAAGIAVALLLALRAPWLTLAAAPATFWFVSSLAVSWYVYDYSPLSRYEWLLPRLHVPPRWLNLHAGLDLATETLSQLFPGTEGRSVDIFDPREMASASIREARRVMRVSIGAAIDWRSIPSQDAVFLIFTAHELRRDEARVRLFQAVAETLSEGGQIAVVEHLRDWRNFLAFGPAFWHFLPLRAWRATATAAGLRVREEFSVIPFVHVFLMEKAI
jgi:hypothetical protein